MRSLKMDFQIYELPIDSRIKIKSPSRVNFWAYYGSINQSKFTKFWNLNYLFWYAWSGKQPSGLFQTSRFSCAETLETIDNEAFGTWEARHVWNRPYLLRPREIACFVAPRPTLSPSASPHKDFPRLEQSRGQQRWSTRGHNIETWTFIDTCYTVQGVPKNPKTIEINVLLELECLSTTLLNPHVHQSLT
jgi:hypothetical protein